MVHTPSTDPEAPTIGCGAPCARMPCGAKKRHLAQCVPVCWVCWVCVCLSCRVPCVVCFWVWCFPVWPHKVRTRHEVQRSTNTIHRVQIVPCGAVFYVWVWCWVCVWPHNTAPDPVSSGSGAGCGWVWLGVLGVLGADLHLVHHIGCIGCVTTPRTKIRIRLCRCAVESIIPIQMPFDPI